MSSVIENCRLCGAPSAAVLSVRILSKYPADLLHCPRCDYVQVANPHWLEEAYAVPITTQDTGLLQRNLYFSRQLALTLDAAKLRNGRFLDYAGGYGVMTRLMRDIGFDYHWLDPYTTNIFAQGFEASLAERFSAISAFEVFEHWTDPVKEVRELLSATDVLCFSTELRPETVPAPSWPYYAFAYGQHIGFFSLKSLRYLADEVGARLLSDGYSYHALSRSATFRSFPPFTGPGARLRWFMLRRGMRSLTLVDSLAGNKGHE